MEAFCLCKKQCVLLRVEVVKAVDPTESGSFDYKGCESTAAFIYYLEGVYHG